MIYNEDTYYVGYHRNVRAMGAVTALVFDTIAGMVANSDGIISNEGIAELLGVTEKYVRGQIAALVQMGYIDKVAGNGRGKKTTYILTEKGEQNAPLYAQKGGTKPPKKGEQNDPLINNNKDNNRDLIRVRENTTAEKKEKINSMKDFNLFWSSFIVDADHENERDRCERVWQYMPDDKQQAILDELETGKKSIQTKSPYVYLYNWKEPLRFMRQGTKAFDKWAKENSDAGNRICMVRYDDHLAWCLAEDLPKMMDAGAELINGDWKY